MSHLNDFNEYLNAVCLLGDKDTAAKNIDLAITSLSLRLIELTNAPEQHLKKLKAWVDKPDRVVDLPDDKENDDSPNNLQKQQTKLLIHLLLLRNELRTRAPKTETRLTELNNAIGEIQDMTKQKKYRPFLDHAWDQFMQALTKLRNFISKYVSSAQHTPATSSYSGIFKPKFYEDAAKIAENPRTAQPRPKKK